MRKKVSFDYYVLLFLFVSFLGWMWEVGIYLVRDGAFVNRGILSGPWLPDERPDVWIRRSFPFLLHHRIIIIY